MAIVVEWLTRSGASQRVERFEQSRLRVGRGLDQDVILDDPYIDAEHLLLEENADTLQLRCVELGTRNGTGCQGVAGGRRKIEGAAIIYSGDELTLGRSRIRVYHSSHPVPPALALNRWHDGVHWLSAWPSAVILSCLVVWFYALNAYTNLPVEKHVQRYVLEALYPLLGVYLYGIFWALIGRVLRGDGRLTAQLSLALAVVLFSLLLQFSIQFLAYHSGLSNLGAWLNGAQLGLIAFFLVNASLYMATHLQLWPRFGLALIVPFAIALGQWIEFIGRDEPRLWVPYQRAIVAPALNFKSSVGSEQFVEQTSELYSSLSEEKK